jgi:hypothetical protein
LAKNPATTGATAGSLAGGGDDEEPEDASGDSTFSGTPGSDTSASVQGNVKQANF